MKDFRRESTNEVNSVVMEDVIKRRLNWAGHAVGMEEGRLAEETKRWEVKRLRQGKATG